MEEGGYRVNNAMFFPIVAAIVFSIGIGGLVIASLAPMGGDAVFNFAAVCMLAGPLIFFFYVMMGLFLEFVAVNRPPVVAVASYAPDPPSRFVYEQFPEGLRRERKGPLNRSSGRATRI